MKHFILALQALGPTGVLLLAILDSLGLPLVGGVDALLIWVSVTNPAAAYPAAGTAVVGSVIGGLILFLLARKGGEAYLDRHTVSPRTARFRKWFREYGLLTIFVPAGVPIVPLPLKVFVLSAGAMGVSPLAFTSVMLLARLLRYFFLAWMVLRLGPDTLPYLKAHLWELVGIAIALFAGLYLLLKYLDRRRRLRTIVAE